jgi:hypothetical protein
MEINASTTRALAESGAGTTDDPEVDELVDGIEETRQEMTLTVEEIGDRLDPRNIVEGAKETVRAATMGKVEDMANTAGAMVNDAGDTVREAGAGIVDRITRNPLPAAMVGIGLGWLAISGRSSESRRSNRLDRYAYDHRAQNRPSAIEKVQQRGGQIADQVGSTVGDAADQVHELAEQVPYQVRTTAQQLGDEAGRMYQQNPLAVGAIAVAVGTAVGLILPVTEVERRAIREPAREAFAKVEDAATTALEDAEQAARDVEQQAREEDLRSRPH